jgi:hypothetical protein
MQATKALPFHAIHPRPDLATTEFPTGNGAVHPKVVGGCQPQRRWVSLFLTATHKPSRNDSVGMEVIAKQMLAQAEK